MWALLPIKQLSDAKRRLAGILTAEQRFRLSYCMAQDILDTLSGAGAVDAITVISCDAAILSLAAERQAQTLNTGTDRGYALDVLAGVRSLGDKDIDKVLIVPADVPELGAEDLSCLDRAHRAGITLCPAGVDGGTNALVFTPPLPVRLMYGAQSFDQFRREAEKRRVPVNIARPEGLARDIDRPDDLLALQRQAGGNLTWHYVRSLDLPG